MKQFLSFILCINLLLPLIGMDNPNQSLLPYKTFNDYRLCRLDALKNSAENDFYAIMHKAEEQKNYIIYGACIDMLVPQDVSKKCIPEHIHDAYKKTIQKEIISNKKQESCTKPKIIISNDGTHFVHNITFDLQDLYDKLIATQTGHEVSQLYNRCRDALTFSPNSKYLLIKEYTYDTDKSNVLLYDIATNKHYILSHKKITSIQTIQISNDSRYIMLMGTSKNKTWQERYKLWKINKQGAPQPKDLYEKHMMNYPAMFHPTSNHIIYSPGIKTLCQTSIKTPRINKPETPNEYWNAKNINATSDSTCFLTSNHAHTDYQNTLFITKNAHSFDAITSTDLPNQSFSKHYWISRLVVPHKKIVTHITNNGHTFQLLDNTLAIVGSYTPEQDALISALATDDTGNYVAAGYDSGAIIIWNISSLPTTHDIHCIHPSHGKIKSLTFTPQQSLLSQSVPKKSGHCKPRGGCTRLWDMHGNLILNLGDNTVTSAISKNGDFVITAAERFKLCKDIIKDAKRFITIAAWNLKNARLLGVQPDGSLSLSQAINFYTNNHV